MCNYMIISASSNYMKKISNFNRMETRFVFIRLNHFSGSGTGERDPEHYGHQVQAVSASKREPSISPGERSERLLQNPRHCFPGLKNVFLI